ncbi:Mitochondrial outer membrane protein iml-2 [Tolypocladium ophioglossoides CBS 100239]|uniref:Inclusion body clearance protein IML2 n=1 Tax=Tolypocladium ophioglossoides (strain CBS 100239) TaxID=1163406 RepID=A0A0L0NDH0_TOLOC|nr:Mitochondrial outer membrane protein iml-2 [Tolypocladium ophioglossoides CBS 100239]
MSPLSGWFRSADSSSTGGSSKNGGSKSAAETAAKEREKLADALSWTALIMNDDIDGAWEGLQRGDSSFHNLGSAVTFFMRSVLGFEKQVMAETSAKLADCETRAWADYKDAQRRGAAHSTSTSRIYPPGTEYELVRAETQLMGAVVGVLHESLVEAMRSFYKLRKAFLILDGIIAIEAKAAAAASDGRLSAASASEGKGTSEGNAAGESSRDGAERSASEEFVVVKEKTPDLQTPAGDVDEKEVPTSAAPPEDASDDASRPASPLKLQSADVDAPLQLDDPVDVFIHSGANMCFGIILLILSLIPPAFSRILSVVGFRGDRARGVRMLWRSAAHHNINGALAGMVLLGYYIGLLGAVDIVPAAGDYDDAAESVGPPLDKCQGLLADLRARYPDSRLWRVEESRLLANDGRLDEAIAILRTGGEAKMKQVAALSNFELAVDAMIVQDWALMRDTFLRCLEINDWSPAMYYYMAGCASLELYRDAAHRGDEKEARRQKTKAEEHLRKAPQVAGKKRLMARQLPVETFLQRKVQKWEAQAKQLGVDLADAVGSSPALEMCYVWNGQKRMGPPELERGVANLSWGRCTADKETVEKIKSEKDETAVWAVGLAALLRGQGKLEEAKAVLEENVLAHDRAVFKGPNKDDYVLPTATYELAVIAWTECCHPPPGMAEDAVAAYRRAKLDECQAQLDKVKAWEAYTLDARMGMRVQSGLETVGWFRSKMGWV